MPGVERRVLVRWLTDHGFVLEKGKRSAHRIFAKGECRIVVSCHSKLMSSEPVSGKMFHSIVATLRSEGFVNVREELARGKWSK